jgi:KaiC/GvpD/RAD55 family RecA-like ATPase
MTNSYVAKEETNIITLNGISILSNGNLMVIVSPAGAGKTNTCEAIASSGLNRFIDAFGFETLIKESDKILYLDTERTHNDIAKGYRRIQSRAKLHERNDNFEGDKIRRLHVRSYKHLDNVDDYIEHLWFHAEQGYRLIIIDQIADFLNSVNDEKEAKKLIKNIEKILAKFDCAIIVTIHPNPHDKEYKARGHIGSMLLQKAESVFACFKADNDTRIITTDFYYGKVRNAYDKVETAFIWDDDKKMFVGAQINESLKQKISKELLEVDRIIELIYEEQQAYELEELTNLVQQKLNDMSINSNYIVEYSKNRGTIYLNAFDNLYYRKTDDLFEDVPF